MKTCLIILLLVFSFTNSFSQKVSIQKWVNHTVDSLKKNHVDTIEYYHQYCGECEVLKPPGQPRESCETESSFEQIENIIIYKQEGKYYSLSFNCNYSPIKRELVIANSPSYFLSIIPILNKRDRIEKDRRKQGKFFGLIVVDGLYDEAFIFYGKSKQRIFKHGDQNPKKIKSDFWIAKEAKLFSLISADISAKNQNPPSF